MMDQTSGEFSVRFGETIPVSRKSWPRLWWLNVLLLLTTFVSTTAFGSSLARSFAAGRSLSDADWIFGFRLLMAPSGVLWTGTTYSVPLILILLAHEMGHYIMCQRWRITATLPFFGPSPTLLGTIGAFIWIRSPIYRRRALFDVGMAGPLAGFVVLLPFLIAGIWNSKVCSGVHQSTDLVFGTPALLRIFEVIHFPGISSSHVCLHPMAMAAWAGLLATAINLLPVGQLDGGHIVYAVFRERGHRIVSWLIILSLVAVGPLYRAWWIWAAAMFYFRRHPFIHDGEPLGRTRILLAISAILLLLLSFSLVPVEAG